MELSRIQASLLYRLTNVKIILCFSNGNTSCENIITDLDVFALWKVLRFTWSAWLEVRDRVRRCTVHNVVLHLSWSCSDSSRQGFYTSSKAIENVWGEGLLLWKRRHGKTASSWITLIAWLNVRIHQGLLPMYIPTKRFSVRENLTLQRTFCYLLHI